MILNNLYINVLRSKVNKMVSFWQHNVPYAVWDSKRVINYKGMGLQMVLRSGRWGGSVRPLVHKRDNKRERGVRGRGRILFYFIWQVNR